MEQKKILWIIFSVILLVVVVVGAGFIWFFPNGSRKGGTGVTQTKGGQGKEVLDPVEWVRKNQEYPGLDTAKDQGSSTGEDFIIVYGENDTEKAAEPGAGTQGKTAEPDASRPAAQEKPLPSVKPETAKPAAAPLKETVKTAVKPKSVQPKTVRVEEYWIQTGSYTSKTRAEEVKDLLSEKGLASKISSKLVEDTNYFRVRLGPYTSKPEAEKFLEWIKALQGFDGSYISLVYTTREVQ
ncbi:MAG: SPOR domain-containing protein [Spirochaetales bacterium]|nr:MAG: SPOR domain-containing protein [Spirochaetales bacterium]